MTCMKIMCQKSHDFHELEFKRTQLFHPSYVFMKTYRCSIDDKFIIVTDLLNTKEAFLLNSIHLG